MGITRHTTIGHGSQFELIAGRLRQESEPQLREPLPQRWVDLILELDARERRTTEELQRQRPATTSDEDAERRR
jgi:hypothetical protein